MHFMFDQSQQYNKIYKLKPTSDLLYFYNNKNIYVLTVKEAGEFIFRKLAQSVILKLEIVS